MSLLRGICGLLLWSGGQGALAADAPTGGLVLGDLQVERAILDADPATLAADGPTLPASGAHRTRDWRRAGGALGDPDDPDLYLYSRHPYQALLTYARSLAPGEIAIDDSVPQAALRVRF